MKEATYPLRPFMMADTLPLREVFAQSIEELTAEDYNEDQRAAWATGAEDAKAFADRLAAQTTLVVVVDGEYAGFGSLKDNTLLDMLYVHPYFAGQGVGTALTDAFERLAKARGATEIKVDASDTAQIFFESRGYVPVQRNVVERDGEYLSNVTMTKKLADPASPE